MPRRLITSALLLLVAGCGSGSTGSISGTVTLNGELLGKGYISFTPEDGQGGTAGGAIEAGGYQVTQLKPGKYRVLVAGEPTGPVIMPDSKDAKRTLSDRDRGDDEPHPSGRYRERGSGGDPGRRADP